MSVFIAYVIGWLLGKHLFKIFVKFPFFALEEVWTYHRHNSLLEMLGVFFIEWRGKVVDYVFNRVE